MRHRLDSLGCLVRRAASYARVAASRGVSASFLAIALAGAPQILSNHGFPSWVAVAEAKDDDWQKESREQEREARRLERQQRREAEQEAKRQRREAEEEARRQRREAEQEERQQREMQQEARRQQREMQKEARNEQRSQSREERSFGRDTDRTPEVPRRSNEDAAGRPDSRTPDNDKSSNDDKSSNNSKSSDKDIGKSDANSAPKSGNDGNTGKSGTATSGKPEQKNNKAAQNKPEKDIDDDKPLPPPKTVLEMLERIATPEKPKPAPVATPAVVPVKNVTTARPAPVKSASKARPVPVVRRGTPDFELLEQGMFRPHEILATNLSPEEMQFAEANGFKSASSVVSPGETGTVRSLIVPKGMTETAALQFLERAAPSAQFGPNHVYRIIPAADGPIPAAAPRDGVANPDLSAKGNSCAAGDCVARELLAWKPATKQCARRVRVGIIDTSFDVSHPAFHGRKFSLEKFSGNQAIARGDWHGTAVLSVLAGNASSSTPGLIPDADFLLASTFRADAQGNAAADTISVLKALAWLDKRDVNIVNMSFSGPQNDQIEAAIDAMAAKGVVFVAAAGNQGPSAPPSYPAAYPQVVAVTAINKKLNSYLHANRGAYVDVAAPGVQVLTALPEGRQGYRTGTSFATPFVTGLLAAMPAVRKGAADKTEMLSRISFQDLGDPGRDAIYGEGLPKAPEGCDKVGGLASLPWTSAAKRMSVGAPTPSESALARPASR